MHKIFIFKKKRKELMTSHLFYSSKKLYNEQSIGIIWSLDVLNHSQYFEGSQSIVYRHWMFVLVRLLWMFCNSTVSLILNLKKIWVDKILFIYLLYTLSIIYKHWMFVLVRLLCLCRNSNFSLLLNLKENMDQ